MKAPATRERKNVLADRSTQFDHAVAVSLKVPAVENDENAARRGGLLRAPEDAVLMFFLLYAAASAVWGIMFGAEVGTIIGEVLVLVMLAFYFPVKEVCVRSPRGTLIVTLICST